MNAITLECNTIAAAAGFVPGADGRLNLPATQETADALARCAVECLPVFVPGDEPLTVTLTGAGPVWGYLCIAHGLHGRAAKLIYAAPNAPAITVFSHGL
jgi:hypothetical protein